MASLANPLLRTYAEAREGGRTFPEGVRDAVAITRLAHQLEHPGEGKSFPGTREEAIGSFIAGGMYPREADIEYLRGNARAGKRQRRRRRPGGSNSLVR